MPRLILHGIADQSQFLSNSYQTTTRKHKIKSLNVINLRYESGIRSKQVH